jgi:hypothetical protein
MSEDDMATIDEQLRALIDDDDEAPPDLPPKKKSPGELDEQFGVSRNASKGSDSEEDERWVIHGFFFFFSSIMLFLYSGISSCYISMLGALGQ